VSTTGVEPPPFLRVVAHPVRWRLLDALVASDRPVRELTTIVDEPQSLVSYHLRKLRDAGLVSARRSSADGRDSYYAIDLARFREQLRGAGGALHPALALDAPTRRTTDRVARVLFLCTGNSARSQIAEALIEQMSGGAVTAESAGSHPKPLHPNAVRVMRERGIDISRHRTKHVDELVDQPFDLVVTLCDRVREVCPELSGHPRVAHWSMSDPSRAGSTDRDLLPAFEATAAALETRIEFLLTQLADQPSRRLQHAER
jgi:ArsR family transcriptional regulator, arsenate/arsenite/antimonite-responsive transcriptional repressor / arsenate reductase (thioredoxin)